MITLTPEQERKVKTLAQHRQKPTENVLDELIPDVLMETQQRLRANATPDKIAA